MWIQGLIIGGQRWRPTPGTTHDDGHCFTTWNDRVVHVIDIELWVGGLVGVRVTRERA